MQCVSQWDAFLLEEVMKKIKEHYYTITEDEITKEMEYIEDGLYQLGDDFYEVCEGITIEVNTSNSLKPQQYYSKQVDSTASKNTSTYTSSGTNGSLNTNSTGLFVFSVLLLAFSVVCFYLSINYFVAHTKLNEANNQLGTLGGMLSNTTENLVRDGVLWLLGGIVSIIIGIVSATTYNNKKQ